MRDLDTLTSQFHQEGYLVIPDVLSPQEAERLRAGVERAFAQPSEEAALYGLAKNWRPKMFEHGPDFEALIDHPGILDLIEAILGPDCHLIAMSSLRTGRGTEISSWHADETVRFPRPKGVPLDPRIQIPCFVINLNYYLCDVDEALGPTQFVPGSHRSGRNPDPEDMDEHGNPVYEGRSAVSGIGKAGTAVLWHDQTWHRGGINQTPDRFRWVQQAPYGRRFIAQRFYPGITYHMPEAILERANSRRKRLLGIHGPGAYG